MGSHPCNFNKIGSISSLRSFTEWIEAFAWVRPAVLYDATTATAAFAAFPAGLPEAQGNEKWRTKTVWCGSTCCKLWLILGEHHTSLKMTLCFSGLGPCRNNFPMRPLFGTHGFGLQEEFSKCSTIEPLSSNKNPEIGENLLFSPQVFLVERPFWHWKRCCFWIFVSRLAMLIWSLMVACCLVAWCKRSGEALEGKPIDFIRDLNRSCKDYSPSRKCGFSSFAILPKWTVWCLVRNSWRQIHMMHPFLIKQGLQSKVE